MSPLSAPPAESYSHEANMPNRFKYRFRLLVGTHLDCIPDLDGNGNQKRNRDGSLAVVERRFQARRPMGEDPGDQPIIETDDDLAQIFNSRGGQFSKFQRAHEVEAAAGPYTGPGKAGEAARTVGAMTAGNSPAAPVSDTPTVVPARPATEAQARHPAEDLPPGPADTAVSQSDSRGGKHGKQAGAGR